VNERGLVRGRRQSAQAQDQLPSLRLGKKTERRHASTRIAAADFPKERAVALRLDGWFRQVWAFGRAVSGVAVTRDTPLLKDSPASRFSLGPVDERVRL